ncbi:hypothetical protein [Hyalangium rubrum]|uniref:Uncharacterized protein n=1 Tax=Hyalangium rubrum TaxID=3103134 RepID=A0ABU5HDX4_9BACT|nr:hypothetical protein [Hyalangium sp. s54d21]MDY7231466.1 hypothetical protein [Hyalangium sp. s54d21]
MSNPAMKTLRSAAIVAAALTAPVALAGAEDTGDVACGSTAAGWNVPNGGLVLSRGGGGGPIAAVLDAVGEYRTHSMFSHGPGGDVTHETMYTPGTNGWPTYCSTPVKAGELTSGFPGAGRINQGAIYQYLYGGGGALQYLAYQRSRSTAGYDTKGEAVSNWLLNSMPTVAATSKQDGGQSFRRYLGPNGAPLNYTLYQYRDLETVHIGGAGWNNGMVCSTMIAHAQYKAGFGAVEPKIYGHSTLVTAGNSLYSSVENECNSGLGFWGGVGSSISCFENICDDAGRQVRNCMSAGRCDTDSGTVWNNIANDGNTVARSISPDRLGGWSGHPYTGPGVSVWAYDSSNTIQWNSGGNVYGCWF